MSEKRFVVETVAVRDEVITDTEKCYSYEDLDEIVDKLNEQQDTISQLEKNFDDIVEWASEIAKRNVVLDERIGEQQSTISQLQDLCGKSDGENAKLRLKNKELQDKIDLLCEKYDYPKGVKNE